MPEFHVKPSVERILPFHVKRIDPRTQVAEAASVLELPLTAAQMDSLLAFDELLRSRAVGLGLIGEGDRDRTLARHVLDSLRAATAVLDRDRQAYDLGSGAGLPGIPVAIACPRLAVELVESRRKRAAFLELAVSELGLRNLQVRWARVQEQSGPVDVCFARAFAPMARAWKAAEPLLVPSGRLVHFAGSQESEIPDLPGASRVELRPVQLLDSGGPLAIITR
jgi:16S rRNA (guanine527-N7)-methyltransferase